MNPLILVVAALVMLVFITLQQKRTGHPVLNWKRLGPTKTDTIFMAWAVVVGLTIYSLADRAIQITGIPVPYGLVWTWLNPYYWTGSLYKWITLIIQLVVMVPMYWLAKKGKLNWRMLHLLLFTTIYFRLMGVFQEVTPVLFAPFVTLNPVFSFALLIQKYPFWTLIPSFSDIHYQCSILGQCIGYTVDRSIYFHGALNPDIATHGVLLFWLIAPLYAWWKNRKPYECVWESNDGGEEWKLVDVRKWNEDRFWTKMMLPMSAIMMFGFIVLMFFGCCAGYHWFA